MAETGAARGLAGDDRSARAVATHPQRLPFLAAGSFACTSMEPAAGLFADLASLEAQSGVHLSFAMGFPAADFPDAGPGRLGHATMPMRCRPTCRHSPKAPSHNADDGKSICSNPTRPVGACARLAARSDKPVIIADTRTTRARAGDSNTTACCMHCSRPGAGRRFPGAVALGLLHDPDGRRGGCAAGVGATIERSIGKAVRCFDGRRATRRVAGRSKVTAEPTGRVPLSGPMTAGNIAQLGRVPASKSMAARCW